jgi:putative flippase GtrA
LRRRLLQLRRFCLIGLTCLALSLTILAGLHALAGVNYLIAYVVAFIGSNLIGYLLNARFTFAVKSDHRGAARYAAVNAALLCLNTAAMKLLVGALGIWYMAAALLLAAANAPIGFLAQRLFTYRIAMRRGPLNL